MTKFEWLHPLSIGGTLLYALMGIIIFWAAFIIIDKITPYDLWREIVEKQNKALGMVVAAMCLGISIIVAAAIAEIEARHRKTPVIVLEVPLLVPLIPGGDLYRMMVSIMTKGVRASIDPLVWLAQEVFVIAAGVILVSTVASLLVKAAHAVRQSVR